MIRLNYLRNVPWMVPSDLVSGTRGPTAEEVGLIPVIDIFYFFFAKTL